MDLTKMCFEVEDNGPGIPETEQRRIFGAFEQADLEHNSRAGGAGLGLAIVHQLVDVLGGKIMVKMQTGRGHDVHCPPALQ